MKVRPLIFWLLAALSVAGCGGRDGSGSGGSASTNLSIVVWSPFLPAPSSYQHLEHLEQLRQKANALMATNKSIFGQYYDYGKLATDSPLRNLLGIPLHEAAYLTSFETSLDQRYIIICSSRTDQRFGQIMVNLKSGAIDSAHDVEALFVFSEMERRLRRIVGTREDALRLFGRGAPNSPSPEQQRARKALAEALFLRPDAALEIDMSAPGGTNEGQGYLNVFAIMPDGHSDRIASVMYPSVVNIFSAVGLAHRSYKFGGLGLYPAWTNLNTQGFLLDSDCIPYPKTRSAF